MSSGRLSGITEPMDDQRADIGVDVLVPGHGWIKRSRLTPEHHAALDAHHRELSERQRPAPSIHAEKTRENKARRALDRQGYTLAKSRRRDPRAIGYGTFQIVDARGVSVAGERMSLEAVEKWADGER
jgi:hypothetical protein